MNEPTRYRAVLSGWMMPSPEGAPVTVAQGPFTVDVFLDAYHGAKKAKWKAELLPTKQAFPDSFKDAKDCMQTVASSFRKVEQDWEVVA